MSYLQDPSCSSTNVGYNQKIRQNERSMNYLVNSNYYIKRNECLPDEPGYLNTRMSGVVDTDTESRLRNYNLPHSRINKYRLGSDPITPNDTGFSRACNSMPAHTLRNHKSQNPNLGGYQNTFSYLFFNPQTHASLTPLPFFDSRTVTREIKNKVVQQLLPGKIAEMSKFFQPYVPGTSRNY
jgi:hypothetical protein